MWGIAVWFTDVEPGIAVWFHPIALMTASRATERIIGPWGSFKFGPLVYPSLYILCHVKALVL